MFFQVDAAARVSRRKPGLGNGALVGEQPVRAGQFIDGQAIGFEDRERSVAHRCVSYDCEIEKFVRLLPDQAFIEGQERLVDSVRDGIFSYEIEWINFLATA